MRAKYHVQDRRRQGPDITLVVVLAERRGRARVLAEIDFRRHEAHSPGTAVEVDVVHVFAFAFVEDDCEPKVGDCDVAVAVDEDVFGLQVAVDDPCLMETRQTGDLYRS